MTELRGEEILARDGPLGALDDVYFDVESWHVRYLVVDTEARLLESQLLIPVACVLSAGPDYLLVDLTRDQVDAGAGVWPLDAATHWLDRVRVCSGRSIVDCDLRAQDGASGRVADLLVDDDEWCVDYIVGQIGHGPDAEHVLLPLDWIAAIDVEQMTVRVRGTRAELRSAPRL